MAGLDIAAGLHIAVGLDVPAGLIFAGGSEFVTSLVLYSTGCDDIFYVPIWIQQNLWLISF